MRTHFTNAVVFTGNADSPLIDEFFVEDGRFASAEEPMRSCEPLITVDLKGAFVMPAFLDAHTHAAAVAETLDAVYLTPPAVTTLEGLVEALKGTRAARTGEGWIEGQGYDESLIDGGASPDRRLLDRVSTTQPVMIRRSDYHRVVVNSFLLEAAGLTDDTPDPEGGRLGRDADGHLDGTLYEAGAILLVERLKNAAESREAKIERLCAVGTHYLERGILTATDMMAVRLGPEDPLDPLNLWREAARRGLPIDVDLYFQWKGGENPQGMTDVTEDEKTGAVRYAGVKLFADGSISGRGAWVRVPYLATEAEKAAGVEPGSGEFLLSESVFRAALDYAQRNGLQLSIHIMGDKTLDVILGWLEGVEEWLEDAPSVRLEHVTFFHPDQLEKLAALKLRPAATTQTIFPFAEHVSYRTFLTPERRDVVYPVRSISRVIDAFALSSDAPATTWGDPDQVFVSVQAAVTRRDAVESVFGGREAVDVATALSLYTGRAALVLPTEGTVGIIEPGARAHFVVLSDNPFRIHTAKLGEITVRGLWRDGIEVELPKKA